MSSTMLNDLPSDLLMEIFAGLPVKTLLQFKCVCKSWYAIIRDPIFITKHVNHKSALSNNGYLAVTRRVGTFGGTFGGTCLISLRSLEYNFGEIHKITIPSPKEYSKAPFRIVGSCNGVLCLNVTKIGDTNFLFNPATSEFKELPKPDYPIHDMTEDKIVHFIGLGFGHDPKSNEYKLVRFSYSKKLGYDFYSGIDVYSLSSNSWRRKGIVLGSVISNSFSKELLNGNLHWRGAIGYEKRRGIRDIIISFCIRDEVCRHIELPEIELDEKHWYPFVRKESLAIVINSGLTRDGSTFTIWVMEEYGIKETWTKILRVGPILARRFVGFGRNEGLLVASSSMMFHIRPKRPDHEISGANAMGDDFITQIEVVNHIESLVPIEGTKVRVKRKLKKTWFWVDFILVSFALILFVFILVSPFAMEYFIHRRIPTSASK
ncbi:F-box protein At3g07870-like [Fagus crenata]